MRVNELKLTASLCCIVRLLVALCNRHEPHSQHNNNSTVSNQQPTTRCNAALRDGILHLCTAQHTSNASTVTIRHQRVTHVLQSHSLAWRCCLYTQTQTHAHKQRPVSNPPLQAVALPSAVCVSACVSLTYPRSRTRASPHANTSHPAATHNWETPPRSDCWDAPASPSTARHAWHTACPPCPSPSR